MSADERELPAAARREALRELYDQTQACTRCAELAATRKTVVFGAGNADAELMFVGEAPGAREDEQGLPFVGQAGKLLETLLGEIGMSRKEVWICNVLKCRPPANRDPQPAEIANCQGYLYRQVELIQPAVICSLGNFSTKLLRDDPTGITRLHGRAETITLGRRAVRLYPIFHPAAALYTPRMLEALRADFQRLPELLAQGAPEQPDWEPVPEIDDVPEIVDVPEIDDDHAVPEAVTNGAPPSRSAGARCDSSPRGPAGAPAAAEPDQLGLF